MIKILFCLILFTFQGVMANDLIEEFDLRTYSPVKNGLKDLTCEIRLDGLTERIKKDFVTLNIPDEIFFRMYWLYPGKLDFEVIGLPKGFKELRQNLKNLVVNRVDYIIPQKLGDRMRTYKLETSKTSDGYFLKGEDPTNTKAVNKVELKFNKEGSMKSFKSYSPLGFQESSFEYEKKSWSKNKWVLEEVKAKTIQGPQVTVVETEIDYQNVVGYGFPEKIKVETTQYVVSPKKEEKKKQRQGESLILFSKYKVNSGAAQKHFRGVE